MNRKSPKYLTRFLLIYTVFSVVMLALYVPAYFFTEQRNEENLTLRLQAQLDHGVTELNRTITALDNLVALTVGDQNFRVFKYAHPEQYIRPAQFSAMSDLLKNYCVPYNLIHETALITGNGYIVAHDGAYMPGKRDLFFHSRMQCEDMTTEEWLETIQVNRRTILPVARYSRGTATYTALTYVSPWSVDGAPSTDFFIATLDTDRFAGLMLDRTLPAGECLLRILSSDGTVLYESGEMPDASMRALTSSVNAGMYAELLIPESVFSEQLSSAHRILTMTVAALLLLAVIAVAAFSVRSAKPIDDFVHSAWQVKHMPDALPESEGSSPNSFSGGFTHLLQGIHDMSTKIDGYAAAMSRNEHLMRIHILEKAIRYGLTSPDDAEMFRHAFPEFPRSYRLALMRCHSAAGTVPGTTLIELMNCLEQTVCVQILEADLLLILLSGEIPEEEIDSQLKDFLQERFADLSLSLIVGDVHSGPETLSAAYQEIQYTWCEPRTGGHLLMASRSESRNSRIVLPLSMLDLQTLYNALNTSNPAVADALMKNCCDRLFTSSENGLYCRHCYALLANVFAQIKLENPGRLHSVSLPAYDHANRRSLFEADFPKCFRQVCDIMKITREESVSDMPKKILAFIDENLGNPDLYVDMVLDAFGISSPTLQKLVKSVTGLTFSAYVEDRRLSLARDQLSCSGDSIEAVALRCGFSSRNAFYKAFKRRFGFAPSEVPKQDSEENEEY